MRHRLLAGHADAVVTDRHRPGLGIGLDPHAQVLFIAQQRRIGQRQETQLVVGVGGVGNQLAEEDLAVAVEGMDHELQQLTNLGLEPHFFRGGGGFGHVSTPVR